MHRKVLMIFAAMAALIPCIEPAGAQRGGRDGDWELLGQRSVGFRADRDVIEVGRRDGRFEKIKLRVRGNDMELLDLKVVYGNGQVDDISVRQNLREGSETRDLDLKGGDRFIKEIRVVYRARQNFDGKATLEVYGKQADNRQGGNRPGKRDWEKLGDREVDFRSDKDVIRVGRSEGRFRKLQLRVRNNDVEFEKLAVVYANGKDEELEVRDRIRAGGESRPIDLRGEARAIREVRLQYRSKPSFRGKATVELWGLED